MEPSAGTGNVASLDDYRLGLLETAVTKKADRTELQAVAEELKSIKKWLAGGVMAFVVASITFGFAALEAVARHA